MSRHRPSPRGIGCRRLRRTRVTLALGTLAASFRERQFCNGRGAVEEDPASRLGSKSCPLDISVLWTADVESPVYSAPVVFRSSGDGRRQIVLATLRSAVEVLEGDGSVPLSWPIELDGSAFHASPALHDVDGDGVQDFCVASTEGAIRWLTLGEQGPYMHPYSNFLGPRRVDKDWYKGLDNGDTEAYVLEGGDGGDFEDGVNEEDKQKSRRRLKEKEDGRATLRSGDPAAASAAAAAAAAAGQGDRVEGNGGLGDGTEGTGDVGDAVDGARYFEDEADADGGQGYVDFAAAYGEDVYGWGDMPYDDMGGYWWGDPGDYYGRGRSAEGGGEPDNNREAGSTVNVDAHVLAAPVFVDVDGDGYKDMLVPASYFFDRRRHPSSGADTDNFSPSKYVTSSLLCWNFLQEGWMWEHDLGQTTGDVENGAYVYSSPTVADLDGDGMLEVIIGTAMGAVHVLDAKTGVARTGFPVLYDQIKGQVAVADVDGDQELEMLFGDSSGMVVCVKQDGSECWNRQLTGSVTSTVSLGDVDGDGTMDLVVGVTTSDGSGEVCALSAENGFPLPHFPIALMNRKGISSPITLVDLHEASAGAMGGGDSPRRSGNSAGVPIGGKGTGLHLLAPSEDGHVYVIEGSTGCVNKIDLGERLLSMVLADDLEGDGTLDLLVGTMSGEVVALSTNVPFDPLNAWSSPVRGHLNGFVHGGDQGVYFMGTPSDYEDVVGRKFSVRFEIVDKSRAGTNALNTGNKPYQVTISAGGEEIFRQSYSRPGPYAAMVRLAMPTRELLRIEMTTKQHLLFEDHVIVGYNTNFYVALKWMLVAPVALAALPFLWFKPSGISSGRIYLPS